LTRLGLYERFRGSFLYDLYWQIADRRILADRSGEVTFYREVLKGLRAGDLILDVGANHGSKTDVFLRLGARVVAVDPDESNQRILRQRFQWYRLSPKPVVVVDKAVSHTAGVETMFIDAPGSAKNTLSQKWVETLREDGQRFGHRLDFSRQRNVETTTLDQLVETHGSPYFVKIDVEGFEPAVLQGLHRPVPFLSFEVNLPEFRAEGLQCIELLKGIANNGTFNYAADCQGGLLLKQWIPAHEFSHVFETCNEESIEIFCKTA
jgi:FkbM family methyltransferase